MKCQKLIKIVYGQLHQQTLITRPVVVLIALQCILYYIERQDKSLFCTLQSV